MELMLHTTDKITMSYGRKGLERFRLMWKWVDRIPKDR